MKRTSLAVLAALAIALVSSTSALAAGPAVNDVYSCQFDGSTAQLTPIPARGPNTGSYNYGDTSATCAHVDIDGAAGADASGNNTSTFTANIASSGTYDSIQCGTAVFTGNPGGTTLSGSGEGLLRLEYTILFLAGNGTIFVTGGSDGDGDKVKGGGAVHITPNNVNPPNNIGCVNAPVTGFQVLGAVAIEATPIT